MFLVITDGILFHKGILRIQKQKNGREDIRCATTKIASSSSFGGVLYTWQTQLNMHVTLHGINPRGLTALRWGLIREIISKEKNRYLTLPTLFVYVCALYLFFKRLSRLSMKGYVPVVPRSHDLENAFLMETSSGTNFGKFMQKKQPTYIRKKKIVKITKNISSPASYLRGLGQRKR
jgi:hypothetical protein